MCSVKYVLLFPLLLAFINCFTNAISQEAIDDLCNQTPDKEFCHDNIGTDPRTYAAANYNGVLLVAISQTINHAIDGSTHIADIKGGITDPLGQKRIGVCDSNYKTATVKFQSAWDKASQNAYQDVIGFVRDGTNAVIDCGNVYRRDGPMEDCPVSYFNQNINKLSEIILFVNNKIIG